MYIHVYIKVYINFESLPHAKHQIYILSPAFPSITLTVL